jgi:hypothetical protein
MRSIAGIVQVLTALVTGWWELYLLFTPVNGGPWSRWYPITFGASNLLLAGGVLTLFPRLHKGWLVAVAAIVPLFYFAGESLYWWIYMISLVLVAGLAMGVASITKMDWIVASIASLVLILWWVPESVQYVHLYLSPRPPSPDPKALFWAVVPSVLVSASLVSGTVVCWTSPKS